MTINEKQTIDRLRAQGKQYKEIAADTGLGLSAIKMYCQRKNEETAVDGYCLQCGKPLSFIPQKKKKKYCSDACRMKWWNTHQDQVNRRSGIGQECPLCGRPFLVYGNKRRVYCSRECYARARMKESPNEY